MKLGNLLKTVYIHILKQAHSDTSSFNSFSYFWCAGNLLDERLHEIKTILFYKKHPLEKLPQIIGYKRSRFVIFSVIFASPYV